MTLQKTFSTSSIRYRLYFYALCCVLSEMTIPMIATKEIANCPFVDTVNVTNNEVLENGSYLYEDIVIPPDLIGLYDYDLVEDGRKVSVPLHFRGCVCRLKPCVKFCCHPSEIKLDLSLECSKELGQELQYSPLINVTLTANGSSRMMHVLDEFVVQQGIPCKDTYLLTPQLRDFDDWQLFENGTLLRLDDMALLSRSEYCLTPTEINGNYILNPANCAEVSDRSISKVIDFVTMVISLPFLLVTIFVYAAIPELRNLHGKCLICHLIALTLGNTTHIVISLENIEDNLLYSLETCRVLGYIGCYAFMAAFFWLSMISFDLWHNLHAVRSIGNRLQQRKRFYMYSSYAWGLPLLVSVLTVFAQNSNIDESLKPGIGVDYCWFDHTLWSPMLYFYGPVLFLMLFNVTMFVLTALQIRRVQKDLARMIAEDESSKHWRSQKNDFGLYFRLFIVMGVSWMVEVFSYMVGPKNVWTSFFWITDFCNCAQGIIIFILFVLKKKVRNLLSKRMQFRAKPCSRSNSTQSEFASDEEISLKEMNQETQTH